MQTVLTKKRKENHRLSVSIIRREFLPNSTSDLRFNNGHV